MPTGPFKNLNQNTRNYIFLAILTVLAVAAISMTYTTYVVATGQVSFNVRNITEASDSCEAELDSQYGDTIISKSYDHSSSRYDERIRKYFIYYRFTTRTEDDDGIMVIEDKMISCEIREFLGYVSATQTFDL